LGSESFGEREFFAVYEFESNAEYGDELRVVLDKNTSSILWPLPENRYRWSFQLLEEHLAEFPAKERSSVIVNGAGLDPSNQAFVQKLLRERAPWFEGAPRELVWSTDVEFQRRLAQRYGQDRCWLAGDAAHQTSPAGMQSMNVGLSEAAQLASSLIKILQGKGSPDLLEVYGRSARDEWRRLVGASGGLQAMPGSNPWVNSQRARILPCLPASGPDLKPLLKQLLLDWT
jgi:2-polyprenyl-6-methoxyphenol hydroxylase-like FAD-dependent oxidoreductase